MPRLSRPVQTSNHVRPLHLLYGLLLMMVSACSGANPVHVFNGFDFDVKASFSGSNGDTTVTVPARGRVDVEVFGEATVKVTTTDDAVLSDHKVEFLSKEERVEQQRELYSVLGAASLIRTEIAYGSTGAPSTYRLRGSWNKPKIRWFFEPPPESIAVADSVAGMTLNALNYGGDGSWRATVMAAIAHAREYKNNEVLAKSEAQRDFGRIRPIVKAVLAHDPAKPDMAEIAAAYEEFNFVYPPRKAKARRRRR